MRRTSLRIEKPQQLVAGAKVANRARWGEPIQAECSAGANERAAGDFHPMLENSRKPCGKRVETPLDRTGNTQADIVIASSGEFWDDNDTLSCPRWLQETR